MSGRTAPAASLLRPTSSQDSIEYGGCNVDDASVARPASSTSTDEEIEAAVTAIVERAIGLSSPGPVENFFQLGARSVHLAVVAAEVAQSFSVPLSLRDLYASPTIATITSLIRQRRQVAPENGPSN